MQSPDFYNGVAYNWNKLQNGQKASQNPYSTALAPEGGFKAGKGGLIVGRGAFVDPNHPDQIIQPGNSASNDVSNAQLIGIVTRDNPAMTTEYLQGASETIPAGFPVHVVNGGDWAVMPNKKDTTINDSVFVSQTDASIQLGSGDKELKGWTLKTIVTDTSQPTIIGRTSI